MLEHGGNLRDARRRYPRTDWIDLSTGINPDPYPVPPLSIDAWHRLPETDPGLVEAACDYYGASAMLAVAGTQAAIAALPRMRSPARVSVAAPSYAEHAHHWSMHGHTLDQVPYALLDDAVARSEVVVVCNPNNPTGEAVPTPQLLRWAEQLARKGGWLVVDEAFGDVRPDLSVAAHTSEPGLIVLRSVGKFFGLAGLRLGFVAAQPALLDALADLLGPWTVSGPAQVIARAALGDVAWQQMTQDRLWTGGERLRRLLHTHDIGASGTALFQWWPEPLAEAFHAHLAQRGIWCRLFAQAARGVRLGLPANEESWQRLERALDEWSTR